MTLADIILSYRNEHNLSRRQFAEQCGISHGFIAMIEKGKNPNTGLPLVPSIGSLRKLAAGLRMSLQDLMTQADDIQVRWDDAEEPDLKPFSPFDQTLIELLVDLTPEEEAKVLDYIRLLRSARRE